MNNSEILRSAVEKALRNNNDLELLQIQKTLEDFKSHGYKIIIFSHQFAKAFWGDKKIQCGCELFYNESCFKCSQEGWKSHLQIMVLKEDPIKYLEQFLK